MDDGKMAEPEMDPLQHIGGGIYRAIGQRSRFKSIMARGENFGDEILDLFWEETAPLMEGITFLARARERGASFGKSWREGKIGDQVDGSLGGPVGEETEEEGSRKRSRS
jgi:hypothetical protein